MEVNSTKSFYELLEKRGFVINGDSQENTVYFRDKIRK